MTEELAKQYFSFNIPTNRRLSKAVYIARGKNLLEKPPIEKGDAPPHGIVFNDEGWLVDGQHTLMAFIWSGVEGWVSVTWGVTQDAVAKIDQHRPRNLADTIRIAGLSTWLERKHTAIINQIHSAHVKQARKLFPEQVAEIGDLCKEAILFATDAFDTHEKYITVAPVLAGIATAYGHVDEVRLLEFCTVLASGMPEGPGDKAAILLRNRLLTEHKTGGQQRQREIVRMTQRAIKAFSEGEHIKILRAPAHMIYRINAVEDLL